MDSNRELYNHLAETYNQRQDSPATIILRKKEVALMRKFCHGLVVDLGCGTGYHLDFTDNVIGLDISEKILKVAKLKSKPLLQGDMVNLPFKKSCADTICCFYGTLNFVGLDCVEEICRAVNNGGKIILSVTSVMDIDKYRSSQKGKVKKFRIEGKPVNMRLFEKEEVVDAFEKQGFKLVNFDSVFRIQKPRWGNFKKYSLLEKLKLIVERIFPKSWGKIYFFVFEKTASTTT